MGFLCLPVWVWGAALQPLGPPELFYELYSQQSTEEIFDNMGTMSVPSRILCLTFKVLQMGVFGFLQKGTRAKSVAMAMKLWVLFSHFFNHGEQ